MFSVPATYAVFDPSQMYSAQAEREATLAAKKAEQDATKAAKQAAKLASAGCGDYSCRICYNVVQRVAHAVTREIKSDVRPIASDRTAQENDVAEFMASRRGQKLVEIIHACEKTGRVTCP